MSDYLTHPEYLALLETVRTFPDDDAPRLILSDWLEEHDEGERAEFIRVQIGLAALPPGGVPISDPRYWLDGAERWAYWRRREKELLVGDHRIPQVPWLEWAAPASGFCDNLYPHKLADNENRMLFTRGFVSEVRLTCAAFMEPDRACDKCESGKVKKPSRFGHVLVTCPSCAGSGRLPGLARRLFEGHPLISVVLVDREPYDDGVWFLSGRFPSDQHEPSDLPKALFDFLPNKDAGASYKTYDDGRSSKEALSTACVAYGRTLAGLPPPGEGRGTG